MEAIVFSMTKKERTHPKIINGQRRARIAVGAGVTVNEVNRLMKQFADTQKMMKSMQQSGKGKKNRKMKGMKNQFPGGFF